MSCFNFHWGLFSTVQLMISHHMFSLWLGNAQNQWWPSSMTIYVSRGLNELTRVESHYNIMKFHYNDVTMRIMASQITGNSTVYLSFCLGYHQRKHQYLHYWPFVRGNPLVTSGFPSQKACNTKCVSMVCRCHVFQNFYDTPKACFWGQYTGHVFHCGPVMRMA